MIYIVVGRNEASCYLALRSPNQNPPCEFPATGFPERIRFPTKLVHGAPVVLEVETNLYCLNSSRKLYDVDFCA